MKIAVATSILALASTVAAQNGPIQSAEALIPGTGMFRCGTPAPTGGGTPFDHPDCDMVQTNPSATYAPSNIMRIPVVVHVISNTAGTGNLSDATVQSQIAVLNEDFRAQAGTLGASGVDTKIEFFLATTDPAGAATTGITRHTSNSWFSDTGSYWTSIAWDTTHYLNIYTNSAGGGGVLGYVPALPQQGTTLGTSADRVVILYSAFGKPASGGAPYNLGRTCTHEVGHYIGLLHTFQSGCGTSSCYTTGDLICDTAAEQTARFGCPVGATSCGSADPIRNYMDYTDDSCMTGFTQEQARRMRCTLLNYRGALWQPSGPSASATARSGAGNLNSSFATQLPVLGSIMRMQLITFATPYTLGTVAGYIGTANVPFNGFTILVDLAGPQIFQLPLQAPAGFGISWDITVPNVPAFAGLAVSAQGVLIDGTNFALTNAFDYVAGF